MKINFKEKLYLSKEEAIEKANELLELNEAEKVTTILFLQQRIDKAIEYMNSEEYFELNNDISASESQNRENYFKAKSKLLKILKGKSE